MTTLRFRSDVPLAAALALLVALSACSSGRHLEASAAPGDSVPSVADSTPDSTPDTVADTVPDTTVATSTTVAETTPETITTEAPAPVPPPAPTLPPPPLPVEVPLLRGTGIGTALWGHTDDSVMAYLAPVFGGVSTDEGYSFPTHAGDEHWTTADGEQGYMAPIARKVCFVNEVCVFFGGAAPADLHLTGWIITAAGTPTARTIEGIEIDDLWSEHSTAITRISGGCYSSGLGGTADGVDVGLVSSGEFFNAYDMEAGTWVDRDPDPSAVSVRYMLSGHLINNLWADC